MQIDSKIKKSITSLKNKKGRKSSSTRWLQRQIKDPYVIYAKQHSYRCRSAVKLIEINEKFKIFKKGYFVIDLGCNPGGWSQVAASQIGDTGAVVAIDINDMKPINNVNFSKGNFLEKSSEEIISLLGGKANTLLSDMAPASCGDRISDHLAAAALCEDVIYKAPSLLRVDGSLVIKISSGSEEHNIFNEIKNMFKKCYRFKPKSSRQDSREIFIIGLKLKNLIVAKTNKNDIGFSK